MRIKLGNRGIAAVEFALMVPTLLIIFIGTTEILTLYRTEAKLNALTYNVSQLVSLMPDPATLTSLGDICTGAVYGLQPFPPKGLTINIASVTLESAATAVPPAAATYDVWEADIPSNCNAAGGTAIGSANAIALATSGAGGGAIEAKCDNAIIVQATLSYPGLAGIFITHAITLNQSAYARWRYATSIGTPTELTCPGCTVNNTAIKVC